MFRLHKKHQLIWRSTFIRHLFAIAGVAGCLLAVTSAEAQVLHTWTGDVDNRFWSIPGNWDPMFVPRIFDDVLFDGAPRTLSGLRSFDGTTVRRFHVEDGAFVNFRPEGRFNVNEVVNVGDGSRDMQSTLLITNFDGDTHFDVEDGISIGSGDSNGRVVVESGALMNVGRFGNFIGGFGGDGTLDVINGGQVNVDGRTRLGFHSNSSAGRLNVHGVDSAYHGAAGVDNTIGEEGRGSIIVSGGGLVEMGRTLVATHSDSSGSGFIEVDGAGSRWTGGEIVLGREVFPTSSSSSLTVDHGGRMDLSGELLARRGAVVTVEDSQSRIEAAALSLFRDSEAIVRNGGVIDAGSISVGLAGEVGGDGARLTVGNGGSLAVNGGMSVATGATLDAAGEISAGSLTNYGTVALRGAGSLSGALIADGGTVSIEAGGQLQNEATSFIGNAAGSSGAVTVANSSWTNTANIAVGRFGDGTLTISGGGHVSNAFGVIAAQPGGTGVATVTGAGSTWTNTQSMFVGGNSTTGRGESGTLAIERGGMVHVTGGLTVYDTGMLTFGLSAPTGNGLITAGAATLAGTLEISMLDGFTPSLGDQFEILNVAGTLSGEFAGLGEGALLPASDGLPLRISYAGGDGNNVVLTAVPEPAGMVLLAVALATIGYCRCAPGERKIVGRSVGQAVPDGSVTHQTIDPQRSSCGH